MKEKKITVPKMRAFSVHLLTASGSIVAFFTLIFASEQQWIPMFWCIALAFLIDGVDGPIARKLKVKEILPKWSGEYLDNIIDYLTYVILPAFILYQSRLMVQPLALLAGSIIVISSAIYYADTSMKTKENFFKGFPVVWNMVIIVLFILRPSQSYILISIISLAILSFFPVWFLHPVRVVRLRWLNLPVFLLWSALCILAIFFYEFNIPIWLYWAVIISSIYLMLIGFIMQLFPKLGKV